MSPNAPTREACGTTSTNVGSISKDQPVFERIHVCLNKCIASGHEAGNRIEQVLDRLLNATPRPAPSESIKTNPGTIEAKIGDNCSELDALTVRLHSLADRLERAA